MSMFSKETPNTSILIYSNDCFIYLSENYRSYLIHCIRINKISIFIFFFNKELGEYGSCYAWGREVSQSKNFNT